MVGRAQTGVDFAIAMGIFLVAVTVVIAFLPEMIEPFSTNPTENPLVADRVANQLIDFQLAGPSPGVLDTTCTLYFFNTTEDPTPCPSFNSTDSLNDKLGIDDAINVNVTIEQNVTGGPEPDLLCGDLTDETVTDPPCDGGNEFALAVGDAPPDGQVSVSVARRGVYLDGRQDAILFVRVWG